MIDPMKVECFACDQYSCRGAVIEGDNGVIYWFCPDCVEQAKTEKELIEKAAIKRNRA